MTSPSTGIPMAEIDNMGPSRYLDFVSPQNILLPKWEILEAVILISGHTYQISLKIRPGLVSIFAPKDTLAVIFQLVLILGEIVCVYT